jgi:hypothetical protein
VTYTQGILMKKIFSFFFMTFSLLSWGSPSSKDVFVNEVKLAPKKIKALEALYRTKLVSGSFWYDSLSGLWGLKEGPAIGQILSGLQIGGTLRADASKGGTGVFINKREIHPMEKIFLQRLFGFVKPGRYWLNAKGMGGIEGGPAQFNLRAMMSGGVGKHWLKRTPGGSLGGDGNCSYYNHPNGSSVMMGNC